MLVGYRAPMKTATATQTQRHHHKPRFFFLCAFATLGLSYLAGGPPVGCRCRPSIRWQCRTQTWAWAPTASQSAAILPPPLASGTRRRRAAGRAGSRRTGSDSIPAQQMERWSYAEGNGKAAWMKIERERPEIWATPESTQWKTLCLTSILYFFFKCWLWEVISLVGVWC